MKSFLQIKKFIKTNHNVRHLQLIKQLCDKIDENSKFISEKRKNITFGINDATAIVSLCSNTLKIDEFIEILECLGIRKERRKNTNTKIL